MVSALRILLRKTRKERASLLEDTSMASDEVVAVEEVKEKMSE